MAVLLNLQDRQKRGNLGSHTVEDIIAQATCSAYVQLNTHGWMYAVRRDCSNSTPTCDQICANKYLHVQDAQTAQRTIRTCAGAVHVYLGRPATGSGNTPKLGLKTLFEGFEKCIGGCGPNYCCCKVKY